MDRYPVTLQPDNIESKFGRKRVERINMFMQRNGLVADLIADSLLLLSDPHEDIVVPDNRIESYLAARAEAEQKDIFNTCLLVSRKAHASGYGRGTLAAPSGTNDFLAWGNHAINFDVLPDDSAVGFDLTAAENIAKDEFPIRVLAIHAASLDGLTSRIGDLYGGEWNATTEYRQDFYPQSA